MTEDEIYDEFAQLGIAFEKLEHEAVFTEEESLVIHSSLLAAHTKNLFLKDKRGDFWILVLPHDRRADLKALAKQLGAGKFSFGKADELERIISVTPGSVTPIASVNAPPRRIKVVFDESFRNHERIAVHPLRNTATIALPFDRLLGWLSRHGVAPEVASLT